MQQAQQADFELFNASKWHIGLVVAQFNRQITDKLLQSAVARAGNYGIGHNNIDTLLVAGAIEIPLVLQHLARTGKYQALLAIGCVIKGETPHFDYVCKFVTEGILRVQLDNSVPIGFGVLTCSDKTQAMSRTGLGSEHIDAVLQQARLLQNI